MSALEWKGSLKESVTLKDMETGKVFEQGAGHDYSGGRAKRQELKRQSRLARVYYAGDSGQIGKNY